MDMFFESILMGTFEPSTFFLCFGAAFVCGLITATAAAIRSHASKSFLISLVLLPMIVATVIMMVNGSIGTGVAVMGAFSLIRFRSVPGRARDIAAIFISMTSGLACASGYPGIALIFTLLVSLVMLVLTLIPLGRDRNMDLHITVPEALQFAGAFDDLFKQYTHSWRLIRARTTNMGSLYKLQYRILLKNPAKLQEFIDALRCRNGNLEISLSDLMDSAEEL